MREVKPGIGDLSPRLKVRDMEQFMVADLLVGDRVLLAENEILRINLTSS